MEIRCTLVSACLANSSNSCRHLCDVVQLGLQDSLALYCSTPSTANIKSLQQDCMTSAALVFKHNAVVVVKFANLGSVQLTHINRSSSCSTRTRLLYHQPLACYRQWVALHSQQ